MARGDTVTDIVTMSDNTSYTEVTVPSDEEWMITGFIGDNTNAIAVYIQEAGQTTRTWFTDMVLSTNNTYIANGYGKWFFNPGHTFSVKCHNSAPRIIYYSGIKTKDTS